MNRSLLLLFAAGALSGCDFADQLLVNGVPPGCDHEVPQGELFSDATDPGCTGVAVDPAPGADPQFTGAVVWVVDATNAPGGTANLECTFDPLPGNCESWDGQNDGSWTIGTGGHGSAVGTEFDCLCADVSCMSIATGTEVRAWTWELGNCAP